MATGERRRRRAEPRASDRAGTGSALPFSVERPAIGNAGTVVSDERRCGLTDQNLARVPQPVSQTCGDVHGVAGDERLPAAGDDRRRCSRRFSSPDPCSRRPRARLDRGANRTECVVLVHLRDAEHRHRCIADELLDGSAMPFENGANTAVIASHQLADDLGVAALADAPSTRPDRRTRTVTVFRTEADGSPTSEAPHAPQKREYSRIPLSA